MASGAEIRTELRLAKREQKQSETTLADNPHANSMRVRNARLLCTGFDLDDGLVACPLAGDDVIAGVNQQQEP